MTLALDIFAPLPDTAEQLRDYFEWVVQTGGGSRRVWLDQRGLSFIEPKHHGIIGLAIPDDGETDGNKVFLRAVY